MSLQEHKKRVIVAVIVIPLLLFIVIKLPSYLFLILLCIVNVVGMWEFLKMYRATQFWLITGIISSLAVLIFNCFYSHQGFYFFAILFSVIAVMRLILKRDPKFAFQDIALIYAGLLYIPTLLVFQWFLRESGWQWIVYLYGCVWTADSFAYYIGKGFGKTKLYPEVSPKKTWAGAYGSLAGAVIASLILGNLLVSKPFMSLAIMGFLIGIVSIFGDLVESMFKRDAGVKDSGFLFPGHGGILDKIDALLFSGLLLYFGMKFM